MKNILKIPNFQFINLHYCDFLEGFMCKEEVFGAKINITSSFDCY